VATDPLAIHPTTPGPFDLGPVPPAPDPETLAAIAAEAEATDPRGTSSRWALATPEERAAAVEHAAAWRAGIVESAEQLREALLPDDWAEYLQIAPPEVRAIYATPDELAVAPEPAEPIHSAEPDVPSGRMHFRSARELTAEVPAEVPWIVRPWIAAGSITEIDGRPKAAGKSTFLVYLIAAVLDGEPFLGEPTSPSPVVLLSEQTPTSLRVTLARAGLADREDLRILIWRDADGASWPDIVAAAVAECRRIGARLLVIDTLPQFANLRGDAENDSGAALEAVRPLQAAAAGGLAIAIARHDRKAGGDVGDSARGSSAFTGAVDVVLALRRGDGQSRPTIRNLSALSRFDETPPEVVIELTPAGYVLLGSTEALAVAEAKAAVLAALNGDELTIEDLVTGTGLRRTSIQGAVAALVESGTLARRGNGRKGDPFRYGRAAAEFTVFHSAVTPSNGTAERKSVPAAGATIDCADFEHHQSRHRKTAAGWVCDECSGVTR